MDLTLMIVKVDRQSTGFRAGSVILHDRDFWKSESAMFSHLLYVRVSRLQKAFPSRLGVWTPSLDRSTDRSTGLPPNNRVMGFIQPQSF